MSFALALVSCPHQMIEPPMALLLRRSRIAPASGATDRCERCPGGFRAFTHRSDQGLREAAGPVIEVAPILPLEQAGVPTPRPAMAKMPAWTDKPAGSRIAKRQIAAVANQGFLTPTPIAIENRGRLRGTALKQ